jgi:hypothetical protein
MKVLITGIGGPTPRSFAISLLNYSSYAKFEFIGTDVNPLSIGLYQKDLFKKSYIVPPASASNYWEVIEKIIKTNNIEYAVILPELEVIEWSKRKDVGKLPCKVLLPDSSIAELLVDKAKMTSILDELDVVPKSVEFHRDEKDLKKISNTLGFPYWVRSSSGSSGLGSLKIEDENSLENWIHINPDVTTFLASAFLSGRNLACKMLYFEGKLMRAAIAERVNYIMTKVAPSGITGNTSFGRLLNEPKVFEEANKAMNYMFKHSGAKKHGFFTIDFKEDVNGKPYITEVNVRHVAFTQCFAAGGANLAEDTMRLLDNDVHFDKTFSLYVFEKDLIFLRDVDTLPILMKEKDLLKLQEN